MPKTSFQQTLTGGGLLTAKSRPPYQQNDYLSWIDQAKRAETGKAGPLFYHFVIAFNPALVAVLVAAALENLESLGKCRFPSTPPTAIQRKLRMMLGAGVHMRIEYRPIGIVRSPHQTTSGTPIQPSRARGIEGTIEIADVYVEALSDLDGFSHIILICHLHRASEFKLKVVPYLDSELRGLFATRAPARPNPIGISVVRLLEIEGNRLRIDGVDLLDGTPVLDIKPYVRDFDDQAEVRCGWLDEIKARETTADDRFER